MPKVSKATMESLVQYRGLVVTIGTTSAILVHADDACTLLHIIERSPIIANLYTDNFEDANYAVTRGHLSIQIASHYHVDMPDKPYVIEPDIIEPAPNPNITGPFSLRDEEPL